MSGTNKNLISPEFVEQLFKTSTIQRWTDHVRPLDLTALGKHAHMMTIAWVLGRRAETTEGKLWDIDWDYLLRGSLYELLRISVLTDIKSPVLEELQANEEKWRKVNKDVIGELKSDLPNMPEWFLNDMEKYFVKDHGESSRWNAYWILKAASSLSRFWEFKLIEHANPSLHDIAETRDHVEMGVRKYQYIPAVLDIYEGRNDLGRFADMCGRLRFQLRWSQTPILPPRPVLDHELIVAYLGYACIADGISEVNSAEMWQRYQIFYGAMFHDLPEVLTRDIISPVKKMGPIGDLVDEIEREWFEKIFQPILPQRLFYELQFFALDEFETKEWPGGNWPNYLQQTDESRIGVEHMGPIIEACDKFAAFMEAYYSDSFGVCSPSLRSVLRPNESKLDERRKLNEAYDFSHLYGYFEGNVKF